ncbi:hypothetical protein [Bradyrhizobium sp. CCBAU 45321]|uniref:hypothetical protein n=1 Tax=Bradyrhizobium sp. CCBAU 45321 TaxID=1641878 RepID=UPI00230244B2|nr:hypothetical protein [Bradyrhizobium sp. CCBAU 45321]
MCFTFSAAGADPLSQNRRERKAAVRASREDASVKAAADSRCAGFIAASRQPRTRGEDFVDKLARIAGLNVTQIIQERSEALLI